MGADMGQGPLGESASVAGVSNLYFHFRTMLRCFARPHPAVSPSEMVIAARVPYGLQRRSNASSFTSLSTFGFHPVDCNIGSAKDMRP